MISEFSSRQRVALLLSISASHLHFVLVVTAGMIVSLIPGDCSAQLTAEGRSHLAQTIQFDRAGLDAGRLPSKAEAERRVVSSAQQVEDYFRPITSVDNLEKWKLYLATAPLLSALQSDAPEDRILRHARETRLRLIGNINGLELSALTGLRHSVEDLITASRSGNPDNSIKLADQQLRSLDDRIQKSADIPSSEEAAAIAAIAAQIKGSNQGAGIAAALRAKFSRPNVIFTVDSAQLLQPMTQVVNRTRAIQDCILGTRIVGSGTLQGTVTARSIDSYGQATVQLTLNAHLESRNTGYNGPVSLGTLGRGDVCAERTLFIAENGISLSPTTSSANLSSQITSINHPLRLVRRITSKKAAEQKPKADAIGREKFRQQVASEFDSQVTQAVQKMPQGNRQQSLANARTTLSRLHLPEPVRTIGSNSHSIFMEMTEATGDQLAAINSAPVLAAGSYTAAVQLHESTIDNMASIDLAGRTMTGEQFDKLLGRTKPTVSQTQDSTKGDDKSFVIDFATFRPIIFEARNQTIRLGFRGTRFQQGGRALDESLEVTADYRPVRLIDGTTYLERTGEVGIHFPGVKRLTIAQIALRKSMQRIFNDRFPPTLLNQPLTLPSTIALDSLRGKSLRITSIDSRDGWLSVLTR